MVQCLSPYSDSLVLLILICVCPCAREYEVLRLYHLCMFVFLPPQSRHYQFHPSRCPFIITPSLPSPPSLTPGSHYLVLFWGSFVISQMLYKWNYTVLDLLRLLFKFSLVPWRCFQVVACINTSLLVITDEYSMLWCTTVELLTWADSSFWLLK